MNNMVKNSKLETTHEVNKTLEYACLLPYIFTMLRQGDGSEVAGQSDNITRFSLKNTLIT